MHTCADISACCFVWPLHRVFENSALKCWKQTTTHFWQHRWCIEANCCLNQFHPQVKREEILCNPLFVVGSQRHRCRAPDQFHTGLLWAPALLKSLMPPDPQGQIFSTDVKLPSGSDKRRLGQLPMLWNLRYNIRCSWWLMLFLLDYDGWCVSHQLKNSKYCFHLSSYVLKMWWIQLIWNVTDTLQM